MSLSRTAVRRGDTYCSPWCGCGCSWEKHQEAVQKGDRLARELGPDWHPRIWENMGWHYEAVHRSGLIGVHCFGRARFWADMKSDGHQWHAEARTPKAAVLAAMNLALGGVNAIARMLGRIGHPIRVEHVKALSGKPAVASPLAAQEKP